MSHSYLFLQFYAFVPKYIYVSVVLVSLVAHEISLLDTIKINLMDKMLCDSKKNKIVICQWIKRRNSHLLTSDLSVFSELMKDQKCVNMKITYYIQLSNIYVCPSQNGLSE